MILKNVRHHWMIIWEVEKKLFWLILKRMIRDKVFADYQIPKLDLQLVLKFKKEQLPWFANWQHWGKGEYVTGLEPATNPLIGQAKARENGSLIFIEPGESKYYDLELEVLNNDGNDHRNF